METNVADIPLSHRAWAWFEKNRNQALLGLAGIFVLGLIIFFVVWQREEKQVRASQVLSNVSSKQNMGGGKQDNPQDYLKVASEFPSSKAAARAVLLAAGALFTDGKYAEAQAQFEKFTRDYRESPLLPNALIGIASCLEAQGKIDQAVTAYKDILTRHPLSSVCPQAKFSLGGLYELQKRPELARDMYEQVERDSRFSILGGEAGMRLEELAAKNPNLAPAALSAAPTPMTTLQVPSSAAATNLSAVTNRPAPAASVTNLPAPSPKK